jgi:hypothetical protein
MLLQVGLSCDAKLLIPVGPCRARFVNACFTATRFMFAMLMTCLGLLLGEKLALTIATRGSQDLRVKSVPTCPIEHVKQYLRLQATRGALTVIAAGFLIGSMLCRGETRMRVL